MFATVAVRATAAAPRRERIEIHSDTIHSCSIDRCRGHRFPYRFQVIYRMIKIVFPSPLQDLTPKIGTYPIDQIIYV